MTMPLYLNDSIFRSKKWGNSFAFNSKAISSIILFFTLLFSATSFAQTTLSCPNERRCTSKDLEVVGARLEGSGECTSCTGTDPIPRKVYLRYY